ncbi:hypothetical protein I2I11_04140 [Pontibacter sp. 172403-2]|uniref:hypothetical protein n=1 Tax=Pontibacter rufus TaxID=2791028 RepID=UPI0018AFD7DF|nr:hypothetical protein [Pontibacter sp. 172403-2]MBF9252474.1 hypothetical protein [Pontibacter sp. 172403-2]
MTASVYSQFEGIDALSIRERSRMFRRTALNFLQEGKSTAIMKQVAQDLLEEEMYEAANGVLQAVAEFEQNAQLSLAL